MAQLVVRGNHAHLGEATLVELVGPLLGGHQLLVGQLSDLHLVLEALDEVAEAGFFYTRVWGEGGGSLIGKIVDDRH